MNRTKQSRRSGFSLIELMVVITILGLLGSIVGASVWRYMRKANITTTRTQMRAIEDAITSYRMDNRRLPDSLEELVGEAGYLDAEDVPVDAWGNEFIYDPQGSRDYDLISLGGDGVEGGEEEDADIDRAALRRQDKGEEE